MEGKKKEKWKKMVKGMDEVEGLEWIDLGGGGIEWDECRME